MRARGIGVEGEGLLAMVERGGSFALEAEDGAQIHVGFEVVWFQRKGAFVEREGVVVFFPVAQDVAEI